VATNRSAAAIFDTPALTIDVTFRGSVQGMLTTGLDLLAEPNNFAFVHGNGSLGQWSGIRRMVYTAHVCDASVLAVQEVALAPVGTPGRVAAIKGVCRVAAAPLPFPTARGTVSVNPNVTYNDGSVVVIAIDAFSDKCPSVAAPTYMSRGFGLNRRAPVTTGAAVTVGVTMGNHSSLVDATEWSHLLVHISGVQSPPGVRLAQYYWKLILDSDTVAAVSASVSVLPRTATALRVFTSAWTNEMPSNVSKWQPMSLAREASFLTSLLSDGRGYRVAVVAQSLYNGILSSPVLSPRFQTLRRNASGTVVVNASATRAATLMVSWSIVDVDASFVPFNCTWTAGFNPELARAVSGAAPSAALSPGMSGGRFNVSRDELAGGLTVSVTVWCMDGFGRRIMGTSADVTMPPRLAVDADGSLLVVDVVPRAAYERQNTAQQQHRRLQQQQPDVSSPSAGSSSGVVKATVVPPCSCDVDRSCAVGVVDGIEEQHDRAVVGWFVPSPTTQWAVRVEVFRALRNVDDGDVVTLELWRVGDSVDADGDRLAIGSPLASATCVWPCSVLGVDVASLLSVSGTAVPPSPCPGLFIANVSVHSTRTGNRTATIASAPFVVDATPPVARPCSAADAVEWCEGDTATADSCHGVAWATRGDRHVAAHVDPHSACLFDAESGVTTRLFASCVSSSESPEEQCSNAPKTIADMSPAQYGVLAYCPIPDVDGSNIVLHVAAMNPFGEPSSVVRLASLPLASAVHDIGSVVLLIDAGVPSEDAVTATVVWTLTMNRFSRFAYAALDGRWFANATVVVVCSTCDDVAVASTVVPVPLNDSRVVQSLRTVLTLPTEVVRLRQLAAMVVVTPSEHSTAADAGDRLASLSPLVTVGVAARAADSVSVTPVQLPSGADAWVFSWAMSRGSTARQAVNATLVVTARMRNTSVIDVVAARIDVTADVNVDSGVPGVTADADFKQPTDCQLLLPSASVAAGDSDACTFSVGWREDGVQLFRTIVASVRMDDAVGDGSYISVGELVSLVDVATIAPRLIVRDVSGVVDQRSEARGLTSRALQRDDVVDDVSVCDAGAVVNASHTADAVSRACDALPQQSLRGASAFVTTRDDRVRVAWSATEDVAGRAVSYVVSAATEDGRWSTSAEVPSRGLRYTNLLLHGAPSHVLTVCVAVRSPWLLGVSDSVRTHPAKCVTLVVDTSAPRASPAEWSLSLSGAASCVVFSALDDASEQLEVDARLCVDGVSECVLVQRSSLSLQPPSSFSSSSGPSSPAAAVLRIPPQTLLRVLQDPLHRLLEPRVHCWVRFTDMARRSVVVTSTTLPATDVLPCNFSLTQATFAASVGSGVSSGGPMWAAHRGQWFWVAPPGTPVVFSGAASVMSHSLACMRRLVTFVASYDGSNRRPALGVAVCLVEDVAGAVASQLTCPVTDAAAGAPVAADLVVVGDGAVAVTVAATSVSTLPFANVSSDSPLRFVVSVRGVSSDLGAVTATATSTTLRLASSPPGLGSLSACGAVRQGTLSAQQRSMWQRVCSGDDEWPRDLDGGARHSCAERQALYPAAYASVAVRGDVGNTLTVMVQARGFADAVCRDAACVTVRGAASWTPAAACGSVNRDYPTVCNFSASMPNGDDDGVVPRIPAGRGFVANTVSLAEAPSQDAARSTVLQFDGVPVPPSPHTSPLLYVAVVAYNRVTGMVSAVTTLAVRVYVTAPSTLASATAKGVCELYGDAWSQLQLGQNASDIPSTVTLRYDAQRDSLMVSAPPNVDAACSPSAVWYAITAGDSSSGVGLVPNTCLGNGNRSLAVTTVLPASSFSSGTRAFVRVVARDSVGLVTSTVASVVVDRSPPQPTLSTLRCGMSVAWAQTHAAADVTSLLAAVSSSGGMYAASPARDGAGANASWNSSTNTIHAVWLVGDSSIDDAESSELRMRMRVRDGDSDGDGVGDGASPWAAAVWATEPGVLTAEVPVRPGIAGRFELEIAAENDAGLLSAPVSCVNDLVLGMLLLRAVPAACRMHVCALVIPVCARVLQMRLLLKHLLRQCVWTCP
jgi:hypothetical protein